MDEATKTMIANLEAKTGVAVAEWTKRIAKSGKAKHGELVAWLKTEHGLTHGYANLLVHLAKGTAAETSGASDTALVDGMFVGARSAMRPAYDAVIAAVERFGTDVELAPKKAYMSLRRNKQWALVQPSTGTRLDVGLVLKGKSTTARLEASGSFNAMVTHRVRVASASEVDKELIGWLREAYEQG